MKLRLQGGAPVTHLSHMANALPSHTAAEAMPCCKEDSTSHQRAAGLPAARCSLHEVARAELPGWGLHVSGLSAELSAHHPVGCLGRWQRVAQVGWRCIPRAKGADARCLMPQPSVTRVVARKPQLARCHCGARGHEGIDLVLCLSRWRMPFQGASCILMHVSRLVSVRSLPGA